MKTVGTDLDIETLVCCLGRAKAVLYEVLPQTLRAGRKEEGRDGLRTGVDGGKEKGGTRGTGASDGDASFLETIPPFLVKNGVVVDGHKRLKALRRAGAETVNVYKIENRETSREEWNE